MNQEKHTYYYGLINATHANELATKVCNALGHGQNQMAINLLLETACVETNLGTYQDPTPGGAGWGLTQADSIGVHDIAQRTRYKDVQIIRNCFGFDLRDLKPQDLGQDPLKAFVFTRCFYKLIPGEISATLAGRAQYWKTHYNTRLGKGTVDKYITKANQYLYELAAR
jgi:hypothetical protein